MTFKKALSFVAVVFFSTLLYAQVQQHKSLYVEKELLDSKVLKNTKILLELSEEQVDQREFYKNYETPPGEAEHAGFAVQVNTSPATGGYYEIINDSLLIWRVKLESPGALGIGVLFDDFHLDKNAALYIYDTSGEYIAGEFNYKNNNYKNVFSSRIIPGESVIVEYIEVIDENHSPGLNEIRSRINIKEISYLTSGFANDGKNIGNAEECHVNINCSEGDLWQNQKRGVARIFMRVGTSYFWCSGSLINNELQDGSPLFLTAAHCGSNASANDMKYWQFYFNLEMPSCFNFGHIPHNVLYGCNKLAEGPLLNGSDFKLLKLHQKPPAGYRPYYNGWSRLDEPGMSGVGIHHPGGDVKKISTYNEPVTSASPVVSGQPMATNSTWRVTWKETSNGWGVTQGGSSGSPLFNEDGLIIGSLTGGSSNCSNTTFPDFYGKIYYHWDRNGSGYSEALRHHLDPNNTGITELQGLDPYSGSYPPPGYVNVEMLEDDQARISWTRPGQIPNKPGWHSYSETYTHVSWSGPERATIFKAEYFDYTYPVVLSKISHLFVEHSSHPWQSQEFSFKIYDHTGHHVRYESPVLVAEDMVEVIYELESPVTFNDKFYVAVKPVHENGHPTSAYRRINYGHGLSYYGNSSDWIVAGDDLNQYVFLSSIYIESDYSKTYEDKMPGNIIVKSNNNYINELVEVIEPFSGFAELKWDLDPAGYIIYKNNDVFHNVNGGLNFVFDIDPDATGYDEFYVTAIYDGNFESKPSVKAYLHYDDACDEQITSYPFAELFNAAELPECWIVSPEDAWEISDNLEFGDFYLEPYEGDNFIHTIHQGDKESSIAWLITPPMDFSDVDNPYLRFMFDGVISGENDNFSVFAEVSNNSFNKVWDSSEHPDFIKDDNGDWLEAVVDLSVYSDEIRLAFLADLSGSGFIAIDKVEVLSSDGYVYSLSLVPAPLNSGEVYGAGNYIAGEIVRVEAVPNVGYKLQRWEYEADSLSNENVYEFLMPHNDYSITARFIMYDPTGISYFGLDTEEITVAPNPAKEFINIYFPADFDPNSINSTYIYNSMGARVVESSQLQITGNKAVINLSNKNLQRGVYLVVFYTDKERLSVRVVVG